MKSLEIKKHEPDELDRNCDKVFEAIRHIPDVKDRISLIEQVLDYLRMEEAEP